MTMNLSVPVHSSRLHKIPTLKEFHQLILLLEIMSKDQKKKNMLVIFVSLKNLII